MSPPDPDARRWPWPAVALLTAGVVLPPTIVATWLRGDAPMPTGLVMGLWLLKLLLVLNGLAVIGLRRWLPSPPPPVCPVDGGRQGHGPLLALLVAGLALRVPGLDAGLWFDEIQTLVQYVRLPLGQLVTTFDSTNQHLVYSVAAWATTSLFGDSAWALRLPAVLFGVASLWAALWFGRRWLPAREVWWSAVILAVTYHHIWFSQNARGYTALLLGTLVATGMFVELLRPDTIPHRRRVWSYALVLALTVVTHVTALVVAAAHGLAWLLVMRRRAGAARWAPLAGLGLAAMVTLACYAPVLPQLVEALGTSGTSAPGIAWQRPTWFVSEMVGGLVRGVPGGVVLLPIAALTILAGVVDTARRQPIVLLLMVFPLLSMAGLLVATGHNLWPRFFFFGAAFVVQIAIHGGFVVLRAIVPRHAAMLGHAGLAAAALVSLLLLPRAWAPKQDYPAAVAWLEEHAQPGDIIVATDMMELPVNAWLGRGWPVVTTAGELATLERDGRAVWVTQTFGVRLATLAPGLVERLDRHYAVVHEVPSTVGAGTIVIHRIATPAGIEPLGRDKGP